MKSPDRFCSGANTNDRIPHRRLITKAKGRVPAHTTLARYSLPLIAQFYENPPSSVHEATSWEAHVTM